MYKKINCMENFSTEDRPSESVEFTEIKARKAIEHLNFCPARFFNRLTLIIQAKGIQFNKTIFIHNTKEKPIITDHNFFFFVITVSLSLADF